MMPVLVMSPAPVNARRPLHGPVYLNEHAVETGALWTVDLGRAGAFEDRETAERWLDGVLPTWREQWVNVEFPDQAGELLLRGGG